MNLFHDLLMDYTLRTVAMGVGLTGAVAGALGVFAVLRRQSLMGDAVSHAALPGIVLAFMLTLSKHPLVLLGGAAIAGWLGMVLVGQITRHSRLKSDAALGIILACFFGLGIVLLRAVQDMEVASQAGLDKFLFGSAASLLKGDIITAAAVGAACLLILGLLWKEFKLLSFDPQFMAAGGWPVRGLDTLLTTLIVAAIAIGLQSVGVVLMSALLVAPAAAARQWSDRLPKVVGLAAAFGAASGVLGTVASSALGISTGPAVVVIASLLTLGSLFFAPLRGLYWSWLRHRRKHREVQVQAVLAGMLQLVAEDPDPYRPHAVATLDAVGLHAEENTLPQLVDQGWVRVEDGNWELTPAGYEQARKLSQRAAGGAR